MDLSALNYIPTQENSKVFSHIRYIKRIWLNNTPIHNQLFYIEDKVNIIYPAYYRIV